MESHTAHRQNLNMGVTNMKNCQICHEPIWEGHFPAKKEEQLKKFICYYCYSNLRDRNYKPSISKKHNLLVCDRCGKIAEEVKLVNFEWLCDDCYEQ